MWKRTVVANRFQNDKAAPSSKGPAPVCMMLIDDHFWFLQPPAADTKVPDPWLLRTPARPREFLRGGDKRSSGSLSLPPHTPSRTASVGSRKTRKLTHEGLSLPSRAPSKANSVGYDPSVFLEAVDLVQDPVPPDPQVGIRHGNIPLAPEVTEEIRDGKIVE